MPQTRLFENMLVVLILILVPLAAPLYADAGPVAPALEAEKAERPTSGALCGAFSAAGAAWMVAEQSAESTCIADCWDGTTRTCTGSTCSAFDSDCPDEQGRCFASGETLVHKKCPPCPSSEPCPGPSCEELDGTYCKYSGTCYAGPSCIAYTCNCFNNTFVCP